jgi:hypothetical protein
MRTRRGKATLGLSKTEWLKLCDLEQGKFYALGPALNGQRLYAFVRPGVRIHPRPGLGKILVPVGRTGKLDLIDS